MTLRETQRLFWTLLTAPEGVAAALVADRDRGGELRARLLRTVRDHGALDPVGRLEIYAGMYFFRLLDVLKEDHPALLAVLGETGFHNLVTDYLLRHPPAHFSLRHAGDRLPAFVAAHPAGAARPYLAELARLERALRDAFDAADAPAIGAATLADVPAAAWAGLRLRLHPSVRLLSGAWAVHRVRDQVDRGAAVRPPDPVPTRLCVWRQDLAVVHRLLDPGEFGAMTLAAQGATFGEICTCWVDAATPEPAAAARAAAALATWLAGGCVAGIDGG